MEITAADSSIKNVMDLYYSWLVNLIGPKGNDRIALLGTITVHDIEQNAPLYTNQIFRQFADRTITISPGDFGAGNTDDRYSVEYDRIVAVAAAELYAKASLSEEQTVLIDGYQGDIYEAITEIKNIRREALDDWTRYATAAALEPGTPKYDLEKAKYYQPYIGLIKTQRQKITRAQAKKRAIWLSVFASDPDGRQLSEVYENCIAQENQQSLPTSTIIEEKYDLDPITIGSAADSGAFGFDTSLSILPSGTLTKILDMKGERGATFGKGQKETHNHDKAWSASAGGGWGLWKANASASHEKHFRESISNLESISLSCDFIGEYWVNRGRWFSSTILENPYVQEVLSTEPAKTALLANVISSLIIVRGLKVIYKFNHLNDMRIWSSFNYKASGSYGIFGIGASIGGGASGSELDHEINEDDRTVTFFDGQNVCRLLALRVSRNLALPDEQIAFLTNPLENTLWGQEVLKAWKTGKLRPGELPKNISEKAFWID